MKLYNFMNHAHVQTDLMGPHHKTWIRAGLDIYPENKEEHEESGYCSYDEAKKIIEDGRSTSNAYIDSNGEVQMKISHLSAITLFSIVNGIAFGAEKYPAIVEWLKKEGYVHSTPRSVSMKAGIKSMTILDDGKYGIQYEIFPENMGFRNDGEGDKRSFQWFRESVEKMVVGSMKRFFAQKTTLHTKDEKIVKPVCEAIDWGYDKEFFILNFTLDEKNVSKREFVQALKSLDMEIYHYYHRDFDWHEMLFVLQQCARDYGQAHWINEDWNDEKNNFKWYDK